MSIQLELSYGEHTTLDLTEILIEHDIQFNDVKDIFIKWTTLSITLNNGSTVCHEFELDDLASDYKYPATTVITCNDFKTHHEVSLPYNSAEPALKAIQSELNGKPIAKKTDLLSMFNNLSQSEQTDLLTLYFELLSDNPGLFYDLRKLNKNEDNAAICDAISNLIKSEL
jgi:hypothetical protein